MDPDVCGRSPTTLTLAYETTLKVSQSLFARKFDSQDSSSWSLLDKIDNWREEDEKKRQLKNNNNNNNLATTPTTNTNNNLHENNINSKYFMIIQKSEYVGFDDDVSVPPELCWELTPSRDGTFLRQCDDLSTFQKFSFGSCTGDIQSTNNHSDNNNNYDGEKDSNSISSNNSNCMQHNGSDNNKLCLLQVGDDSYEDSSICLDIMIDFVSKSTNGLVLQGYECLGKWNQLFRLQSDCTISLVQPVETVGKIKNFKNDVNVCIMSAYDDIQGPFRIVSAECIIDKNHRDYKKQLFEIRYV